MKVSINYRPTQTTYFGQNKEAITKTHPLNDSQIYNKLSFEARKRKLTADELTEIAIKRELNLK